MKQSRIGRTAWLVAGLVSVATGVIGIFLPLLPTVPFLILAAFCFARSNPVWEQKLLDHRIYGPHIRNWRERGAITRKAKYAATAAFAASIGFGLWALSMPWVLAPPIIAALSLTWLWTRPEV